MLSSCKAFGAGDRAEGGVSWEVHGKGVTERRDVQEAGGSAEVRAVPPSPGFMRWKRGKSPAGPFVVIATGLTEREVPGLKEKARE